MQTNLFGEIIPQPEAKARRTRHIGARLRFEIFKRDGFRCVYCGKKADASGMEVDHVIAVASGGTDDPRNLVTSCCDCNRGKSDRPLDKVAEFVARAMRPLPPEPPPVRPQIGTFAYLAAIGKKGGKAISAAKQAAARANGKKGGRPPKKKPAKT